MKSGRESLAWVWLVMERLTCEDTHIQAESLFISILVQNTIKIRNEIHFERNIVVTMVATAALELMRGSSRLAMIHCLRIVLDEGENLVSLPVTSFRRKPHSPRDPKLLDQTTSGCPWSHRTTSLVPYRNSYSKQSWRSRSTDIVPQGSDPHEVPIFRRYIIDLQHRIQGTGIETDDELLSDLQQHYMNIRAHCSLSIFSIDQNRDSWRGTFISSCKHLVCHSCLSQCYKREGDCVLCSKWCTNETFL
jgi:hypothetical protein